MIVLQHKYKYIQKLKLDVGNLGMLFDIIFLCTLQSSKTAHLLRWVAPLKALLEIAWQSRRTRMPPKHGKVLLSGREQTTRSSLRCFLQPLSPGNPILATVCLPSQTYLWLVGNEEW